MPPAMRSIALPNPETSSTCSPGRRARSRSSPRSSGGWSRSPPMARAAPRGSNRWHRLRGAAAVDRASLETLWAVRRLASPALARLPENRRSLQVVEDGCVPLERLADYVTGIRAAAAARGIPVAIFGHAGDGHVHVNALPDLTVSGWRNALTAFYWDAAELLLRLGGTPSGEHGVGRLRAGL